tara:strand:- start:1776 stop:3065 length:1290 start_codon:yes stop_codon:yes gene_type:complete
LKLILVELNEINFDAVRHYCANNHLPGFQSIIDKMVITESEEEYKNLEPWIQWPSVHTGKKFNEHKVFRLGDFVNSNEEQFFEKVEKAGFRVGAVSPMNAKNNLKSPAYFIPDPWTQTKSDGSFFSKSIHSAVSQAVNDNSQSKLTLSTIVNLLLSFLALVNPLRFLPLIFFALSALTKSWRKALFLDLFLYEIHKTLFRRKKADFSTIFLNAGAHIQHHYFYNSSFISSSLLKNPAWYIDENDDPFLEMLKVYDYIIQDVLKEKKTEVIISTGLSQKPFDELKFYYRLKDHKNFLTKIGISFEDVIPRMTRDFLVTFDSIESANTGAERLNSITLPDGLKLFGEIDNRGKDLFVVLTYPHEITNDTLALYDKTNIKLYNCVTFVAIKNGEHQSKGFSYFSEGLIHISPPNNSHVSKIHDTVLNFYKIV